VPAATITFPNRAARFAEDVKREVGAYFTERGISEKANAAMVAKTVILLGGTVAVYLTILFGGLGPWPMLGLAVLMGVGVAGVGFSVSHDALHGAYSGNPVVNKWLGLTFDLFGANGYLWKITHNVIHHTYTNIHGVDEDLSVSPLLRLSPEAPLRPIHRWQHLYGFAAYSTSTLFWVFVKDYKYFLKRDLGPYRDKKHPAGEVASLLAMKLFYYGWSIVVPLMVLDLRWWQFAIGYLAMHVTAGTILGIVFQLAHVVEGTEHPLPNELGEMEEAWMVHEMETTSNFGRRNRLLNWYVGGLNFQVEHHLFPRVCSIHYPAISPIVERMARRHGVAYNDQPTFRAAVASHYRMLRRLGPEALARSAVQVPAAA
jgi:linoleoyl-CoA desaturase